MSSKPSRGEVWLVNFDPVQGHEQGGKRPCIVLSDDLFNHGPAELLVVVPITSKQRSIPMRVQIDPPEGGLKSTSFAMPEMIRAVSLERLIQRWGIVSAECMNQIAESTRVLLRL